MTSLRWSSSPLAIFPSMRQAKNASQWTCPSNSPCQAWSSPPVASASHFGIFLSGTGFPVLPWSSASAWPLNTLQAFDSSCSDSLRDPIVSTNVACRFGSGSDGGFKTLIDNRLPGCSGGKYLDRTSESAMYQSQMRFNQSTMAWCGVQDPDVKSMPMSPETSPSRSLGPTLSSQASAGPSVVSLSVRFPSLLEVVADCAYTSGAS